MTETVPTIYFLYGDDEFAIAQFLKDLEKKLGDENSAALNSTRLDGKNLNLEELLSIAAAMPFLARRRIVILDNPLGNLIAKDNRNTKENSTLKEVQRKFLAVLEQIPETTGLCLVELITDKEKRKKLQWFFEWAQKNKSRTMIKEFSLPKGGRMVAWIQEQARLKGGRFTSSAAASLAGLVGSDTRLAAQEIEKLLAYVNYNRSIENDDVELITANTSQADIFALVDAISTRQGRQAMSVLQRILEQQEPILTFGMIIRQFRLLLLAREVLDHGGNEQEIAKQLRLHPYVAEKITPQSRRFDLAELEFTYRRLLDLDEAVKTGSIPVGLALETFVVAFTHL